MTKKNRWLYSLIDKFGYLKVIFSKIKRNISLYSYKTDFFNTVFIEVTSCCNLHCEFCPSDSLLRKKQDIKEENMLKILSELHGKNKSITFHVLGEPLLNKNIFKYLSLCDEYNINVQLITNMALLTKEILEKILEHKCVTSMVLSLNTIHEESFKLRGSNMKFEEYIKILENTIFNEKRIASNCRTYIGIMNDYHCYNDKLWGIFNLEKFWQFMDKIENWKKILISQNAHEKSEFKSFAEGFYFTNFEEIPKDFYNHADEMYYEITPNLVVYVKHVGKFGMTDSFVNYLNKRKNCQYKIKNIPQLFLIPCWSATAPCVLSNGEITCCCVDVEGTLSLGNIESMSLEDAVKSRKRALVMKHPFLFNTCRKCKGRLQFKKKKNSRS